MYRLEQHVLPPCPSKPDPSTEAGGEGGGPLPPRRLTQRGDGSQPTRPPPSGTGDPSHGPEPGQPPVTGFPGKIYSLSCSSALHLLRSGGRRQSRCGSLLLWSSFRRRLPITQPFRQAQKLSNISRKFGGLRNGLVIAVQDTECDRAASVPTLRIGATTVGGVAQRVAGPPDMQGRHHRRQAETSHQAMGAHKESHLQGLKVAGAIARFRQGGAEPVKRAVCAPLGGHRRKLPFQLLTGFPVSTEQDALNQAVEASDVGGGQRQIRQFSAPA